MLLMSVNKLLQEKQKGGNPLKAKGHGAHFEGHILFPALVLALALPHVTLLSALWQPEIISWSQPVVD